MAMKMKTFRSLLFIFLTVVVGLGFCKKPDSTISNAETQQTELKAVIVFSIGESKVTHLDGTEEKARLGVVLKVGDVIETGPKGKIDIQFDSGSSIRIAPSTKIDFTRLTSNQEGGQDTQVSISSGKLFADVKKSKKSDSFTVVTPTAIAGVRGTKFIVDSNPKLNKVTVKVLEGSVFASPRVAALEKLPEEAATREDIVKLSQAIQASEVILDDGKSVVLVARKEKLIADSVDTLDIPSALSALEKEKPNLMNANFTKSEEQELRTIIKLDEKTASELIALNESAQSADSEGKVAELERKRKELEEKLASLQEQKKKEFESSLASTPKELKSNKDIVSYYEKIEKIQLINGNTIIGAIINQEEGSIIVHTEKGIIRVPMDEVDTVIYDFQTKVKF